MAWIDRMDRIGELSESGFAGLGHFLDSRLRGNDGLARE